MKSIHFKLILSLFTISFLFSCKKKNINFNSVVGSNSTSAVASLQNLTTSSGELDVIALPASVDQGIRNVFKWYTKVDAPNGKPIHILGQDQWTIEQMAYVRSVMQHYLTDVSGIPYGNKSEIANAIADANGAMTMYNTTASNSAPVTGQDLQANETVAVGTSAYLDGSIRNAAFEEVLHFVHDYGLAKTYPAFQAALENATVEAMNNQLFIPWGNLPVADYDNEYFASLNDAYWGTTEFNSNDMPYLFLSREACHAGDPLGTSLMNDFLPSYFASTVFVSASFSGTFYTKKDPSLRYTSQSQYYKDLQLLGSNNSHLHGNDFSNHLIGNSGNNELKGGKANDTLNGGDGMDTAIFSGAFSEYTINTSGGITTITDQVPNRDGIDHLTNIEQAIFSDQTISL